MALKTVRIFAALMVLLTTPAVASDLLPSPAGLQAEISFWKRIFAEVPSTEALVHDSRYLGVVYEVAQIPPGTSPSGRRRIADQVRGKYRTLLNELAMSSRSNLNREQQRVLTMWPADVSSDDLQQAARRIRFQQGLADRFHDGMVRSGAWKPHIVASLQASGVPTELVALPHVESSFNPEARSHVGASGLWQFTRSTGQRFMQIDYVVDERRDPFLSSEAAAKLLAYNYSILESWPLAITAYNHGVAGMRRAVKKLGTNDIEEIIRNYDGRTFGFASRNFYVAFVAALEIDQNAERYFGPLSLDAPGNDILVKTPDYIAATTLQIAFRLTASELRSYNPALMPSVWDGTKYVPKGFRLRLPEHAVGTGATQVFAAIPDNKRFNGQTPDLYHKVQRGESLSVIAARYDTSIQELVSLNGLRSRHRIRSGQTLRLPYTGQTIGVGVETYVVRNGDSISKIATRAGMKERDLVALNSLSDRNRIYAGQVLQLRVAEVSAMVAPEPADSAMVALEPAEPVPLVARDSVDEKMTEPLVVGVIEIETQPMVTATIVLTESIIEEIDVEVTPIGEEAPIGDVLLADPSDYVVADDGTIEVQAAETLGHYADWLEIRTQKLRDLNGYSFRQPLVIGHRLRLSFSEVNRETFMARRIAHHREIQEAFFVRYRITETTAHNLRRGESVWDLTRQRYKVPVWLLRQYNPDLDIGRVKPGMQVVFPQIERIDMDSSPRSSLVEAS